MPENGDWIPARSHVRLCTICHKIKKVNGYPTLCWESQGKRSIQIMAAEAIQYFRRVTPAEPRPEAVTESYRHKDELAYLLSQHPLGTRRPMKVIVVGAGLSGLSFAREVQVGHLAAVDLVIYEKNSSVGGTWFENRYPGCVLIDDWQEFCLFSS